VGDRALQAASQHLTGLLRSGDWLCRWGGDEFIVLFEDVHTRDLAIQLATRLHGIIATPLQLKPNRLMRLFLGASIGVALTTDEKLPVTDLINQADQAMYLAKKSGKNSIQYFNEI
jgi:diguanylate cyclase (GGDEF)-like protein